MSCWCNNLRVNCLGVRTCDSLPFFFLFFVRLCWVWLLFIGFLGLLFSLFNVIPEFHSFLHLGWAQRHPLGLYSFAKMMLSFCWRTWGFFMYSKRESFQKSGSLTLWLSSFMYTGRKHWDCIVSQWGTNTTRKPGCGGTSATSYWTRETSRGTAEINWVGDPRAPDEKRSSHQETATGTEVAASAAATGHTSSKTH